MNVLDRIDKFLGLGEILDEETAYQKFFRKKLKEWGVSSPAELSDADKKKFFSQIEKEWKGKNESFELSEKIWSGAVATKWTPPPGLFTKGATEIARVLAKESGSLKQAMSRLNFYINRAGKNLPAKRKKVLNMAKEKLRKEFEKK